MTVDASKVVTSGLKANEISHLLLYYNTIPVRPVPFILLITANDSRHVVRAVTALDNAIKLLGTNVRFEQVLVRGSCPAKLIPKDLTSDATFKFVGNKTLLEIFPEAGIHVVNEQRHWIKFFTLLESFHDQCTVVTNLLSSSLPTSGESTTFNQQTMSQIIVQPQIQKLIRTGPETLKGLHEAARSINTNLREQLKKDCVSEHVASHDLVIARLNQAQSFFRDIQELVERVEALLERRQEVVREKERRKTVEKEINEVMTWVRKDGEESLIRFSTIALDAEEIVKQYEADFEKFYFISMVG